MVVYPPPLEIDEITRFPAVRTRLTDASGRPYA